MCHKDSAPEVRFCKNVRQRSGMVNVETVFKARSASRAKTSWRNAMMESGGKRASLAANGMLQRFKVTEAGQHSGECQANGFH